MSGSIVFTTVQPTTFEEAMDALVKADKWLAAEIKEKERYMNDAFLLRAIIVEALTTGRPSEE